MKKLEITILNRRLNDIDDLLKSADIGGMNYYRVEAGGNMYLLQVIGFVALEVLGFSSSFYDDDD